MIGRPLPNLRAFVIYTLLCFDQHVLQRSEGKLHVLQHFQIGSHMCIHAAELSAGDTGTTGAQTPLEGTQSSAWETLVGSRPEQAEAQSRLGATGMTLNALGTRPERKPAGRLHTLDEGV